MKKKLPLHVFQCRAIYKACLCLLCYLFSVAVSAQTTPIDTLVAPDPQQGYGFGYAVAVENDDTEFLRLISSEINHPVGSQFPRGVAYTYQGDKASGLWTYESMLEPPDGTAVFGGSVAINTSGEQSVAIVGGGTFGTSAWRRDALTGTWDLEFVYSGINKPGGGGASLGNDVQVMLLETGEELVILGAPNGGNLNGPVREGSAYAFVRSPENPPGPGAWEMEERILAPDGEEGDEFGTAVGLLPTPGLPGGHAGDAVALIGAIRHTPGGCGGCGTAYVYVREGLSRTWSLEDKLLPTDAQQADYFGDGIGLLPLPHGLPGELLALIGSQNDDDLAPRSGAAYVFRREYVAVADTFRWVEETKLLPALGSAGHEFGTAVALTADTLADDTPVVLALVGNQLDDVTEGLGHPGEASLFVRSTATGEAMWTRRAVYQSGEPETNADWFGSAVAFARTEEGPLALVGAYRSDAAFEMGHPNGQNAGAVFVYEASVTTAGQPEGPEDRPTNIHLYPNPATEHITVESDADEIVILDMLGRVVLRSSHRRIDVSAFPAGLYLVRAGNQTRRFVVAR